MRFWHKVFLVLYVGPLLGCALGYYLAVRPPRWRRLPVTPPPDTQRLLAWTRQEDSVCAERRDGTVTCLTWAWQNSRRYVLGWQPAPPDEAQTTPNTCGNPPFRETPPPPPSPARQVLRVEDCRYEFWRITDYAWLEDGSLWVRHDRGDAYGAVFRGALLTLGGAALGFVLALGLALLLPTRDEPSPTEATHQ